MAQNIQEKISEIENFNNMKILNILPKNIMIEVTNKCNCKCIFCANRKMKRQRRTIDSNLVNKALTEAKMLKVKEIGFYVNGEPLMDNNLNNYIKKAKELSYEYIYITTNGILAKKELIQKLFETGLNSIKFSINSIERENYKLIHGIDKFDTVMRNLKEVYILKKEKFPDCRVYVSYIKTKYNNYSDRDIKKIFEEICDEVVIQNVKNQGGLISNIEKIKCEENKESITRKLPCFYPFKSIVITCEGYVTACCMDFHNYLAYGDLKTDALKNIWNNEIITNFRRNQLEGKIENTICQNCINNIFERCEPLNVEYYTEIDYSLWKNGDE